MKITFPLHDLKAPHPFASCALVRLVHYFPDVRIFSDGEESALQMAVQTCREVFDDTVLPILDELQDEEESMPG